MEPDCAIRINRVVGSGATHAKTALAAIWFRPDYKITLGNRGKKYFSYGKKVQIKLRVNLTEMNENNDILTPILERNRIRKESGLPLLDIRTEFERNVKQKKDKEKAQIHIKFFDENPAIKKDIEADVLAAARAVRQDPTWAPQGLTNGMMFTIRGSEKMNAAFQKWLLAQQ